MFDYSKLKGRIIEKGSNYHEFAEKIGITDSGLSLRLNNHMNFKQMEIKKACEILEIPDTEIKNYFFTV